VFHPPLQTVEPFFDLYFNRWVQTTFTILNSSYLFRGYNDTSSTFIPSALGTNSPVNVSFCYIVVL